MNYSTIQLARERLNEFENDYRVLVKKINLSLFTLAKTNLSAEEKSEVVLHEEKDNLAQKYRSLIGKLSYEKETILRQVEKKITMVTPLRQKVVKTGYCYFCDISIAADFPYKLRAEEQNTLGIEIAEGAAFCSQECLLGYCKEYKNREKLRQEEGKRSKEQIEKDKMMVSEIQGRIANLTKRINKLERREYELELTPESDQIEKTENKGLVKKPNPLSRLERVRKLKGELNIELEKAGEELQKSLIILSLDEQKEKERKNLAGKSFLEKGRITDKEKEELYN
ncbi:4973_t:CDS:2 [Entrophospora sp. SA101]|nr:9149_t:CDS:2 [Entrophospora sp. SA101]CAJ0833533.1 4973_t:CDS:2 [Entrophospora sp. SA101]